ncbi:MULTISPECIES: DUF2079 domain-containing protein [unclassified Coleofasciculus]|uniref:DUF2079 domain-containing protein n=1 Tax=unclassified Coleofasciculus TaxID=2692782 RepID=UPI001882A65C|nr:MULTISPECIES: DUF2079 domain-containing protein [unclassified Coleofasciculus]MBE9128865.1 DUF2079 domain-containing protein [Coleofasciculus sp. LEGE 07081]MBE9151625.1 DUF2079 domain-containing protein [Coleofasciculus sp. LEGE 07092]
MRKQRLQVGTVGLAIAASALILFGCSSLRHALFQSAAFDLGIFDQGIYLISQGEPPICSLIGFHILGDHGAWILYPLSLLYKIYADVHWLFAVQAIALALGALPTFHLARQAGLKEQQATAMAVVYLLYPLIFNINLFDFHPEVMALPALLAAILAARLERIGWFSVAILFILGCKAVLGLTVAAMGVWLLLFEKKRWCGAIALVAGIAWFLIASQVIIPRFSGQEAAAVGRYAFLGDSVLEIAKNLLLKPGLVLGNIFTLPNLEYLILLVSPLIWGISLQHLAPLVGAIPTLLMNLITDYQPQKDLTHQYSLPVLPFLLLAVISTLAASQGWLQNKRGIILWSLVAFVALGKFGYFGSRYLESVDTWYATREAVAQIETKGSVLVPAQVAPHLTHRPIVKLAIAGSESADLAEFDYVLLNMRHPGWGSSLQVATSLLERLKNTPEFQLSYQRDEVYLFIKES